MKLLKMHVKKRKINKTLKKVNKLNVKSVREGEKRILITIY